MTSVSKDASTRLVDRRLGREPERFVEEEALEILAAFKGDLCTTFGLDLERVFRGEERRDGPGCAVVGGARFSGRVEGSMSRFVFKLCCSGCSCSCFDYEKISMD